MNGPGTTQDQNKIFRKYAWMVLLGFSIMYAFMYNGRLNMGLALPMMTKELGWSLTMGGVITSVLFWTYGLGHLVNGRLGEILGVKRFIMAGILLSVFTNWIISFCTGAVVIAVLWGFNGYFQSMVWSPGMSLLSNWWAKKERGFTAGFANGFSGIAQIIVWFAVVASVWIVPEWGWRSAFRIPVISLFIVAFVYWYMCKEKPSDVGLPNYEEEDPEQRELEKEYFRIVKEKGQLYPYVVLFSQWRFDVWCVITALSNLCRYGLLTWIPMYYVKVMGMNVKAGIVSSVVLPVGMALGTFLVPWATDKFFKNNRTPAVMICGVLSACTLFLFPSMNTVTSAAIALFWAGFFVYAINGVVWAYSMDVGSRAFAGTAAGILDWAAYMGAAVQAVIFGYVLDTTGNWTVLFVTVGILCITMTVLGLIVNERPKSANASADIKS